MSQPLNELLDEIRSDLVDLPFMKRIYDSVPEQVNELPGVVVAAMGGRCWLASHGDESASTLMCEHDIRVEIHIARKDLPTDTIALTAIAHETVGLLYSGFVTDRFNGTLVTTGGGQHGNNVSAPIDYSIGPSTWGGTETRAFACDFRVATIQEVAR